ncbi:hypothetical protein D3C73_1436290 [compost metagenome]
MSAQKGVQCSHAKHVRIADLQLTVAEGSLIELHQCKGAEFEGIDGTGADGRLLRITGHDTTGIVCRGEVADTEGRQISIGPNVRSGALIRQ